MDNAAPAVTIDPDEILVRWTSARQTSSAAPRYESIVRLGPKRWGLTVRLPDGERTVHELARVRLIHT